MALPHDAPAPIEVHLRDGEHLVVSVAEGMEDRDTVEDVVLETILFTDGTADEVARAIHESLGPLGLSASASAGNPRLIRID